jgi:hypothetical protein
MVSIRSLVAGCVFVCLRRGWFVFVFTGIRDMGLLRKLVFPVGICAGIRVM